MKDNKRIYVDIHVLQTVPPSCVNRDDTGSPKTCIYGGVTRARVSSQSWKRAVRLYFQENYEDENPSFRTKKLKKMIVDEISRLDDSVDAEDLANKVVGALAMKSKNDDLSTLVFISSSQVKALAQAALKNRDKLNKKNSKGEADIAKEVKAELKAALKDNPGIDIALFGRMLASDATLNVDACVQVAHAISTHRAEQEYDYFTAVDDLSDEDHAGSSHIGTAEFNSSTLYRYANVNVHGLCDSIGDAAADTVKRFTEAFIKSMPTGKQNSYANRTLPGAVMICLRKDQPINMSEAFEEAVPASEEGYMDRSVKRLSDYAGQIYSEYAAEPYKTYVIGRKLASVAEPMSFNEALDSLKRDIEELMGE